MAEELLLEPAEAFRAIKVRRAKGYKMIQTGELPSIKIGRLRRIPVDALKAWVARQVEEAAAAR